MVKRIFIKSLIIPLFFVCMPAFGQTFKISTLYPDGTAILVALKNAAKEIDTNTKGRVKFKFYPGGVMGDDKAVFRKIRIGQLHGAITQGGAVAQFYKDSQVYNTPLAFKNFEEVDYVRSKMDQGIIDGLEKSGWITFGLIDGGFAYVMANQPVKNVSDLRQQKLWLPANDPASEKASKAFEVKPIVLNIGEVLTSLQTGAINAIAVPPGIALTLQWFSRVKYMTDLPLMYAYGLMTIQKKSFSKLSPEDQKVTRDTLLQVFKKLDADNRQDAIKAFDAIKNQGIEIVVPEENDLKEWQTYGDRATADLISRNEFSQAILDILNGHLKDFRSK